MGRIQSERGSKGRTGEEKKEEIRQERKTGRRGKDVGKRDSTKEVAMIRGDRWRGMKEGRSRGRGRPGSKRRGTEEEGRQQGNRKMNCERDMEG